MIPIIPIDFMNSFSLSGNMGLFKHVVRDNHSAKQAERLQETAKLTRALYELFYDAYLLNRVSVSHETI